MSAPVVGGRAFPVSLAGDLVGPRAEPVQFFIKPRLGGVIASGIVQEEDPPSIAGDHLVFDDVRRDLMTLLPIPVTALAIERVGRVYRGVVESDGKPVLFAVDSRGFKLRDPVDEDKARELFRELSEREMDASRELHQRQSTHQHDQYVAELSVPQIKKSLTASIERWLLRKSEPPQHEVPPEREQKQDAAQKRHKPYLRRDPRTGKMEYVKGKGGWDLLTLKPGRAVTEPKTRTDRELNALQEHLHAKHVEKDAERQRNIDKDPEHSDRYALGKVFGHDLYQHVSSFLHNKYGGVHPNGYEAHHEKIAELINALYKIGAFTSQADIAEEQQQEYERKQKEWEREQKLYKKNQKAADAQTRKQQAEARGNYEYLSQTFPDLYEVFGKRLMVVGLQHYVAVERDENGNDKRDERGRLVTTPSRVSTGLARKPDGFLTTVNDSDTQFADARVRMHLKELASLPAHILAALKRAKVTVWVSPYSAAETDGEYHMRTVTPSGYDKEDTFLNCGGFYNSHNRMIVLGAAQTKVRAYVTRDLSDAGASVIEEFKKRNPGVELTLGSSGAYFMKPDYHAQAITAAHEVGHAIGDLLQMSLHVSTIRNSFTLAEKNPFTEEHGEEAQAAYEAVKNWTNGETEDGKPALGVRTKGELYRALLAHTKDLYEGTDRQLHAIARQYYDHFIEHGSTEFQKKVDAYGDGERHDAHDDDPELVAHHRRLLDKVSEYERQGGSRRGRQEFLAEGVQTFIRLGKDAAAKRYDAQYADWLEDLVMNKAANLKMWAVPPKRLIESVPGTLKNKPAAKEQP